jgi:Ca-activated chloride channel family protein
MWNVPRIGAAGAASGLVLLWAASPRAQQPATFRAAVDLVPVFVTVTGPDGVHTADLTRDDFTILDNGKPQPIVSFSDQAQAISVSLILDTSSSMASALPRVFAAATSFLDQLRPDDRAMVGTLFYQGPPFTSDTSRIRTAMGLVPPDPGSPVWGALDRALTTLEPEINRRVVVIYTDGKDAPMRVNGRPWPPSGATESSVRTRAESAGVMIYAIGFEGMSLSGSMKSIAARSGGRATELRTGDDLAAALTAVADELHHQYLLGFTPTEFDGRSHRLEIGLRRPGLVVRARRTYVAARPNGG